MGGSIIPESEVCRRAEFFRRFTEFGSSRSKNDQTIDVCMKLHSSKREKSLQTPPAPPPPPPPPPSLGEGKNKNNKKQKEMLGVASSRTVFTKFGVMDLSQTGTAAFCRVLREIRLFRSSA